MDSTWKRAGKIAENLLYLRSPETHAIEGNCEVNWWSGYSLINGVFKGGGAKGVAYAGAVRCMRDNGIWFGAVAGSSAGAITASLIAAGYTPEEMEGEMLGLLGAIRRSSLRLALGLADALLDNRRLGRDLEQLYATKLTRPEPGPPVTFAEIHDLTGITLYVVALDLHTGEPIVFSTWTTPNSSVRDAVLASSAIPAGFPSGRALCMDEDVPIVHRLTDGGAWANYPRFVFRDKSFREWLQTLTDCDLAPEGDRATVGFVLNDEVPRLSWLPEDVVGHDYGPEEFDAGTLQSHRRAIPWLTGFVLSSRLTRSVALLAVFLIGWAFLRGYAQRLRELWTAAGVDTTGLGPLGALTVGTLAILAFAAVIIAGVLFVIFGRVLGDVVIPAAQAALSVGSRVPPWVGAAYDDHVIGLRLPYKLTTMMFRPDKSLLDEVDKSSYARTAAYLAEHPRLTPACIAVRAEDGRSAPAGELIGGTIDENRGFDLTSNPAMSVIVLIVLVFSALGIAFAAIEGGSMLAVVFGPLLLLSLGLMCRQASENHAAIAAGVRRWPYYGHHPFALTLVAASVVVGCVVLAYSAAEARERSQEFRSDHTQVRVTSAQEIPLIPRWVDDFNPPRFAYGFRSIGPVSDPHLVSGSFRDTLRLELGDTTFVEWRSDIPGGRVDRVTPGPNRFITPLIGSVTGIVLIAFATRALRLYYRDRQLAKRVRLATST